MKRILTLVLSIIFVLSLGTAVLATGYTGTVDPLNVLLMNSDTGETLYSKDIDSTAYSAGLVKLMTAYVTVKNIWDLDTEVTVSADALYSLGSEDITLYPQLSGGEIITVRDLLGGMLVASSNDAALALASYIGGSVYGFVDLMNSTAKDLGMTDTVYKNPTGQHHGGQVTTASDLAILIREIIKHPELMSIFSSVSYTIPATNFSAERTVYNTNRLICEYSDEESFLYEYATGMIAGYTYHSGGCLAATAEKYGTKLICIILGDISYSRNERWTLAADLFDYGFELYAPAPAADILSDIPLTYSENDVEYTVEADFTDIYINLDSSDGITATVSASDETTGTAVYTDAEGNVIAEVPVTLTAIITEEPEIEDPEPVPDENTQEPEQEPIEEEPAKEPEKEKKGIGFVLAIIISIVIVAAAFFGANFTVKSKSKGRHSSEKDSFHVKFRQHFMTWLLFAIIALILIIIVFSVLA